jgi:hypothetical protein
MAVLRKDLHEFEPDSMVVYLVYEMGPTVSWTWELRRGNRDYLGTRFDSKEEAWADMMIWLNHAQALEIPMSTRRQEYDIKWNGYCMQQADTQVGGNDE